MNNIKKAVWSVIRDTREIDSIRGVLLYAVGKDRIHYETIQEFAGLSTEDVLLEIGEWRLLLLVRSSRCGDWDARLLMILPREVFEMPNVSRALKESCVHIVISGVRIGAACAHHGLSEKTGTLIAVLKGAGIISPKLMGMDPKRTQSSSPLYEFNPCMYGETQRMIQGYEISPVCYWCQP
jgi:hypothetical protein